MSSLANHDRFKEFYLNNEGKIYKSIELCIGNRRYSYDIRWGDPKTIFDPRSLQKDFPLAVTVIPHRKGYPNPCIFLHEMLDEKYGSTFEMIVAHELGHLWLHDVVGFNNPNTTTTMDESQSEHWADYFSYCFFRKYRNSTCLDDFTKVLAAAARLQIQFYGLDSVRASAPIFNRRVKDLELFDKCLQAQLSDQEPISIHMCDAIEVTLTALGDILAPS